LAAVEQVNVANSQLLFHLHQNGPSAWPHDPGKPHHAGDSASSASIAGRLQALAVSHCYGVWSTFTRPMCSAARYEVADR
jgi:hypothetical protein